MVNTVLTDKTGTLTRNVMEFFKASIGGVSYGTGVTEIERTNAARRGLQIDGGGPMGMGVSVMSGGGAVVERNPAREQYFNFFDERILGGAWASQPNAHLAREFFRMLALCHTVIPDGGWMVDLDM
jgi:phospholipid-transporting ATPase